MNALERKSCGNIACRKLFEPSRRWSKFCSDQCRFTYHNDVNRRVRRGQAWARPGRNESL